MLLLSLVLSLCVLGGEGKGGGKGGAVAGGAGATTIHSDPRTNYEGVIGCNYERVIGCIYEGVIGCIYEAMYGLLTRCVISECNWMIYGPILGTILLITLCVLYDKVNNCIIRKRYDKRKLSMTESKLTTRKSESVKDDTCNMVDADLLSEINSDHNQLLYLDQLGKSGYKYHNLKRGSLDTVPPPQQQRGVLPPKPPDLAPFDWLKCSSPSLRKVQSTGRDGGHTGTDTSKQPIRTRYLGHVTGYQPIRNQYFLIQSVSNSLPWVKQSTNISYQPQLKMKLVAVVSETQTQVPFQRRYQGVPCLHCNSPHHFAGLRSPCWPTGCG
eukprot:sb/3466748/